MLLPRLQEGNTALAIAVRRGRKDCVSVLMEYKADANVFNKSGSTPLMIAAAKGRTTIAVILMQNEANSNLANSVSVGASTQAVALAVAHVCTGHTGRQAQVPSWWQQRRARIGWRRC